MKHFVLMFATLGMLFACTPEENNTGDNNGSNGGGGQNNEEELTVTGEALDVTAYSATLTGYANLPFELGDAEVGIMYDKVQSFESAKKVAATELDGNNKFTVTATGLEPSTKYYYKSYVQNGMAFKYGAVKTFTTQESKCPAGEVDLGIVMTREDGTTYNLYWASSNLCESGLCPNPEDYGDYYAWGETETKSDYSWSTYKFGTSLSGPFSKYNTKDSYGPVDNKTVLETGPNGDDVASKKLGGKWRMPTDEEWTELRTKCAWTWKTNYNGTGINGRLVTAPNGNSIFLPAAGYRRGTNLYNAGSDGSYWSSSLYTGSPSIAWGVYFNSDDVYGNYGGYRHDGQSVRPVTE